MEAFHTEEYKGYTIELFTDQDPMNPREWDNLGTMVCSHTRYTLGDVQTDNFGTLLAEMLIKHGLDYDDWYRHFTPLTEALKEHCADVRTWPDDEGFGYTSYYTYDDFNDDLALNNEECITEALERLAPHLIVMNLYLYDHGGITMNTTGFLCAWDSGQVGIIYMDIAETKKEMSWNRLTANRREHMVQMLISEVAAYDAFISGQICGYEVTDAQGEDVNACWGFIDWELAVKEAHNDIDCIEETI